MPIFLAFLCAACSFMLSISYTGIILKWMHLPGANLIYYNWVSLGIFVALTATLILSVQLTDITKWAESHRKFLVGNILIPWFFIFIWSCFVILFQDTYQDFFGPKGKPWEMVDYELKN